LTLEGQAVIVCVDVLYNVEVVYSVLLTPSYTVVPDPDTRALLA
jgi:hypothetical protein